MTLINNSNSKYLENNLTKLANKLKRREFDGEIKLSVYDMKKDISFNIDGDSKGWAASIIKFPIMIAALKEVSNNKLSLEEHLAINHKFTLEKTDIMSMLPNGQLIKLPELICEMIVNSDNEATNMIANRIGVETINNFMWDIDMNNSMLGHLLCPNVPRYTSEFNKDGSNITTPNDMVKSLRQVYDSNYSKLDDNTRKLSDYFFNFTKHGNIKYKIGFISDDEYGDDVHEVGIIDDRLIYAIMINKVGQKEIKNYKKYLDTKYAHKHIPYDEDGIYTAFDAERKFANVNKIPIATISNQNIIENTNSNNNYQIQKTNSSTANSNNPLNKFFNILLDPIGAYQHTFGVSPAKKTHYMIKNILNTYLKS
jgi:beta-lactamase class A